MSAAVQVTLSAVHKVLVLVTDPSRHERHAAPGRVEPREPPVQQEGKGPDIPHVERDRSRRRQYVRLPRGPAGEVPGGVQVSAETAHQNEGNLRHAVPGEGSVTHHFPGDPLLVRQREKQFGGVAQFDAVVGGFGGFSEF